MKTFILSINYAATGEGLSQFIFVEQAETKEQFIEMAYDKIDAYFLMPLKNPDMEYDPSYYLYSSDELPSDYLERLKAIAPPVGNVIERKRNEIGRFAYFSTFHLNLS